MLIFPSFTIKQKQKQTKNTALNINRKGKLFNLRSVAWDEEEKETDVNFLPSSPTSFSPFSFSFLVFLFVLS